MRNRTPIVELNVDVNIKFDSTTNQTIFNEQLLQVGLLTF